MPWRVALALQTDGWWLRSDIIWHKRNPMPESVDDRPSRCHEYLFLLSKSRQYFYDAEAVKEPQSELTHERFKNGRYRSPPTTEKEVLRPGYGGWRETTRESWLPSGRNKRSVWSISSESYSGLHFATFPTALVEPCILAGTSAKGCCPKCGAPWRRQVKVHDPERVLGKSWHDHSNDLVRGQHDVPLGRGKPSTETTGWSPTCTCGVAESVAGIVLDPFAGSGTVGKVALELGRNAILIELNLDYARLIQAKLEETHPGFSL
jgi:DNA modification methylase